MSSGEESEPESRIEEDQDLDLDIPERKRKPGIIYLSSVPEVINSWSSECVFIIPTQLSYFHMHSNSIMEKYIYLLFFSSSRFKIHLIFQRFKSNIKIYIIYTASTDNLDKIILTWFNFIFRISGWLDNRISW